MKRFKYSSGQAVKPGDQILYYGEPGQVEFVAAGRTGDPSRDWYIDQYPGGGFMIATRGFGSVFLAESDTDEDLAFVSRSRSSLNT
jgi:hypothetical protein